MSVTGVNAASREAQHDNWRNQYRERTVLVRAVGAALLIAAIRASAAGNVPANAFAWSENGGWVNFAPTSGPGVTVAATNVSGFAWAENMGWVNFAPTAGGVVNNGGGVLSGYAWGENVGWINFAPDGCSVTIDRTGQFHGFAWGENIGWINFATQAPVITTWRTDVIFADGFEPAPCSLLTGTATAWSAAVSYNTH
jgi:hypothetical protein